MLKKISNFLNLAVGGYIALFGALIGIVAMILSIVSSNCLGFQINELPFIVILSLVGLALAILPIFTGKKHGNSFLSVYLPLLVSAVAFGVCFVFVLQARSYLIGTLWATQLDASNPDAVAAMNTGAPSFIMFVVSMVIITVSSFFSFTKGEKVEEK